jgi:tetratricopeptide (TPR) repeat protein
MLDLQAEQYEAGQSYQDLYETVIRLKQRHDLHPCSVQPRDGLALRRESERDQVQDLVRRFRRLPVEDQQRLPALLNSLAQLEVVVGDLEVSQRDFQEVIRRVRDPISRAEAHHNVYCVALERGDLDVALSALSRAVALDAEAFEPFPFTRYEPVRIREANDLGVSFLCEEHPSLWSGPAEPTLSAARGTVLRVVKSLRADAIDRSLPSLVAEWQTLQHLDHPVLPRIIAWGQGRVEAGMKPGVEPTLHPGRTSHRASPASASRRPLTADLFPSDELLMGRQERPYVVLEHFEGIPLDALLAEHGPLDPRDWLAIAWPLARALHTLHQTGILHRSLHPGCVFVGGDRRQGRPPGWRVKLLDVGLPIKRALIHANTSHPQACRLTTLGRGIAQRLDYTPVELLGRPRGFIWVGPHSDVYGFGRLCALALTGKPAPDAGDRVLLSQEWRQFLDDCCSWTIQQRLPHFGLVLDRLSWLAGSPALLQAIESQLHEDAVGACTSQLASAAEPGQQMEVLFRRANALARQGAWDQAIADLTGALALSPGPGGEERSVLEGSLFCQRGLFRWRHCQETGAREEAEPPIAAMFKQLTEALADFTEAIARDPLNLEAHANRGLLHAQLGQYEQAIADFSAALAINSRDDSLFYNRGNAHHARGDLDRALADYTQALALNPENVWAFGNRARTYWERGEVSQAIRDYSHVLHLEPDNLQARIDRAAALADLGRLDEALADYNQALQGVRSSRRERGAESPEPEASAVFHSGSGLAAYSAALCARLFLERGQVHGRLGNHEQAIADFTESLNHATTSSAGSGPAGEDDPRVSAMVLALHHRGRAHLDRGDREQALADFNQALQLDPGFAPLYFSRGQLHALRRDPGRALADFSQALQLDPQYREAYLHRANLHAERGDQAQASADYSALLQLDPNQVQALSRRGGIYLARGEVERALADYTRALEVKPEDSSLWASRAEVHVHQGQREQALADYTQALTLDPASASVHCLRGSVYAARGDLGLALADYHQAILLSPQESQPYLQRGNLYAEQGQFEEALADYTSALQRDPEQGAAYYNRGSVHLQRGAYQEAIQDFDEVLRRQPGHARALNNRGNAHWQRGEVDEALADFTAALACDPTLAQAYHNRAQVLEQRGEREQALADYTQALAFDPDDLPSYHNRSWLHMQGGDHARALADTLEAHRRAPDDPSTHNNLAWLLATFPDPEARDLSHALDHARRACELTSWQDAACLDTLALVCARAGQREEAIRQQRAALELAPESLREEFQRRLEAYERERPPT